jgi:hypothetical protein
LAELDKTDLQYALKASEYTMVKAKSAYQDAQDFIIKLSFFKKTGQAPREIWILHGWIWK